MCDGSYQDAWFYPNLQDKNKDKKTINYLIMTHKFIIKEIIRFQWLPSLRTKQASPYEKWAFKAFYLLANCSESKKSTKAVGVISFYFSAKRLI